MAVHFTAFALDLNVLPFLFFIRNDNISECKLETPINFNMSLYCVFSLVVSDFLNLYVPV